MTVSDRLRVRSKPKVSDASIKYEPLLPLRTMLYVDEGPVEGSGYWWYKVRPVTFELDDGPGWGWVAAGGKDGEPWIGYVPEPKVSFVGTEDYEVNGAHWTRYLLGIDNGAAFPAEMFAAATDLPPCGLNDNSSRTWTYIAATEPAPDGNGTVLKYLGGSCGVPEELTGSWFAIPRDEPPPPRVFVIFRDRLISQDYESNSVRISP